MLSRPIIRKFFALLLIGVLSLKGGAGLYFHDYLHIKKNNVCTQSGNSATLKYACSCITDYYLPFTATAQQTIGSAPVPYQEHCFFYAGAEGFAPLIFYSLRAPPAALPEHLPA
jgi:hypothetical protein